VQRPEELWQEFPIDPTPTPTPEPAQATPAAAATPVPTPTPTPTSTPQKSAAATATPTPGAPDDASDGKIELPGGASITYPAANGTEGAITGQPPPVPIQEAQADSGELVDVSGQAGLYVVLVAVLVVLVARWLLNHTWRAAVTVAVMLIGTAMVGLILLRWATDLGIVG
jgi:hypothetical protein